MYNACFCSLLIWLVALIFLSLCTVQLVVRVEFPSHHNFCPLQKSHSVPLSYSFHLLNPKDPISALIVTPPSADAFFRAHRHSIPGHRLTNYLKFLHELAAKGSTIAHLFSTAVISGSSSAPNLQKEMQCKGENVGKSRPDIDT